MEVHMNYIEKIKNDKLLLCSTVLLIALALCFAYIGVMILKYIGGSLAFGIVAACIALFALTAFLHCKKTKIALVIEILLLIYAIK